MDIIKIHQHFLDSDGVCTDSRNDVTHKLFFALKGENFDGNQFVEKALESGAELAIADDKTLAKHPKLILVENVLVALQELATFHRNYLGLPILAITGSNGKTTTKELIAAVLKKKFSLSFTKGNLNNHIGVPLTLLSMTKNHEMGLVEMGASHKKEIECLCRIAQPDYGYITNFGKAHLEGFGGFEGVVKGKSELYDFLIENNKTIFVNADDSLQMKQSRGGALITFSETKESDYQIKFESAEPFVEVEFDGIQIKTQLIGDYNAKNSAVAICVGKYFDVKAKQIKHAIESYRPDNNRSQILKKGSTEIILDAYNANPTSMQLALENFERYQADNKVIILGDMFEVGKTSSEEHQHIVDFLEKSTFDKALVCGENFAMTKVRNVKQFETFEELKNEITSQDFKNTAILIKGSRGMALERVINSI